MSNITPFSRIPAYGIFEAGDALLIVVEIRAACEKPFYVCLNGKKEKLCNLRTEDIEGTKPYVIQRRYNIINGKEKLVKIKMSDQELFCAKRICDLLNNNESDISFESIY